MPLTVYETPASVPVGTADHDKMHEENGQRVGGAGLYSPPPPLGSGSDDRARLVTWLASSPANCTVGLREGYLVSAPLPVPSGRRYLGRGIAEYIGGHVTLMNGANPADATTGVIVPQEWDQNIIAGAPPTIFENVAINGNAANNTGTYACLLMLNYWSRVLNCNLSSPRLDHLLLTPQTKNGSFTSSSLVDSYIYKNRFRFGLVGSNGAGVRQLRPAGQPSTNADLRCLQNHFESMQHGIWADDAAGWTMFDNHIWARRNGIHVADGWYALTVLANYIDGFGNEDSAGPWYGIRLRGWGVARIPACHANQVHGPDPLPASATGRYWYWISGGNDQAAMDAIGNRALGPSNNPSALAHGFVWDASDGTFLLDEGHNLAYGFNAGQDKEYVGAGRVGNPGPNWVSVAGTTHTLAKIDRDRPVELANAGTTTVTVPSGIFSAGDYVEVCRMAGPVTIAQGSGMTLRAPGGRLSLASQYSTAGLRFRSTSEAVVAGDLV